MTLKNNFSEDCDRLEHHFKQEAEKEESVYLPRLRPTGRLDFVFVGREPSLGHWAESPEEAREKIMLGFKDFSFSIGDFILHYCIRKYLCCDGSKYYITNLSKGAMRTREAEKNERWKRYRRWYSLLSDELDLVSKQGTKIITVGIDPKKILEENGRHITRTILHYSNQAARYRVRYIRGRESEFQKFKTESPAIVDGILEVERAVLQEADMPESLVSKGILRLREHKELSESQMQLIFGYKTAFQDVKEGV